MAIKKGAGSVVSTTRSQTHDLLRRPRMTNSTPTRPNYARKWWPRGPLADRFWQKVDKGGAVPEYRPDLGGCWVWLAHKNNNGYGYIWTKGERVEAHRVSYELHKGPIPEGLEIDHLCRVRHCVNPEHLEAVTERENKLRSGGMASRNAAKTHCPQGHPYSAWNTKDDAGSRRCRTCKNARQRAYVAARKAANGSS